MLVPTIASEEPTDTLPVLAQYLHAWLGPRPLRPPVAISFDVDETLVDTKTSLAHGITVACQVAASLTSRVVPDELVDAYHAAFGVVWTHPADTGTYSVHGLVEASGTRRSGLSASRSTTPTSTDSYTPAPSLS